MKTSSGATKPLTIGLYGGGWSGWMGGLEYFRNLIFAVRDAERGTGSQHRFVIITEEADADYRVAFEGMQDVRFAVVHRKRPGLRDRVRRRLRIPAPERHIDRLCSQESVDFLYPYDGSQGPVGCRIAAWIPDFQHRHLPEFFSDADADLRTKKFGRTAVECPRIVFSSRSVLSDFQTFHPEATTTAHVIPFRVSVDSGLLDAEPWEAVTRYHLPPKFLLVSNQFWQHKNHLLLLEAIAIAKRALPDVVVVLTGRLHDYRRPAFADEVVARIQTLGIHEQVRLLGLIPKRDQMQLLRAAHAMVQPSLFEGWNTGVEEARAVGKVVLMSRIDVHVEQAPPGGVYFEPRDAADLAAKLSEVWRSPIPEWSRSRENEACRAYRPLVAEYGRQVLQLAAGETGFEAAGMSSRAELEPKLA